MYELDMSDDQDGSFGSRRRNVMGHKALAIREIGRGRERHIG